MSYFLDGYNLIRCTDWLSGGSLRDQRERLLRFVETRHPQGRHSVTVVFDGRADVTGPAWAGTSRVLFSSGKDADQVIKDTVDQLTNPRDAVVVTNDRAIQRWVRAVGAKVMKCEEFMAAGQSRFMRARAALLTSEDVMTINDELKDLWKLK